MIFDLSGKTALVTGASSGLGRHFALALAQAGARVALAARRTDRLAELQAEIEARDRRAIPIRLDVRDSASVKDAVACAETELGPIAVLVNNAGIVIDKPAFEHDESDWNAVLDTDLKGAWLMAQETARHMAKFGHGGSIINIASVLGQQGAPGIASYCAAKGGLISLTQALAGDLAGHDIRVNAIAPGYFVTDLNREFLQGPGGEKLKQKIPQRRFGQYQDLDGALLLLASDASRYITGSVITVDGGLTAIV